MRFGASSYLLGFVTILFCIVIKLSPLATLGVLILVCAAIITTNSLKSSVNNFMPYVKLTEHNFNECETWHFYIPLHGNEINIDKLKKHILKNDPSGDQYVLDTNKQLSEVEVDTLVKFGNESGGYMDTHNKLSGELFKIPKISGDDDELYKGGIAEFMRPWPEKPGYRSQT